ncbi:MAG: winged helix-turn-helix transcriptional regulator [Candidatus Cloacimonetes bacterium]|nr:winged helix-turn-helix transcriptional regulator [Candidatus Cloacimonadota bacterium]
MKNACLEAGVPEPEVEIESGGYWLKFTYKELLSELTPITTVKTLPETLPEKTKDKIIVLLKYNPNLTLEEISRIINMSISAVKRATKKLQDEGKIKRLGAKNDGRWEVIGD